MTAHTSYCRGPRRRGAGRACAAAVAALLVGGALPGAAQHLLDLVPVSLEVPDQQRVRHYAAVYSSAGWRPWMQRILGRAALYADHVLEQLEERGLPAELVFLPAIESSYVGVARSPAGAVGLWQLMTGTARLHGLVVDELIDERRDFWKATEVALRILEVNYRELGSWELALAAYNAGLGRVRRDVQRAGTRDFWELRRRGVLPRETSDFVPRFFGLVLAMRTYPAGDTPALDQLQRWQRITVPPGVELRQLGKLSGISGDLLEQANAELMYGLTPTVRGSKSYLLKVPADAYLRLLAVLEDPAGELVRLHRHIIRSGDTMSELAEAFNVSVALIRHYNAGVHPRRMRVGAGLRIPLVRGVDPGAVRFPAPAPRDSRPFEADYRVARGDSLWRIARSHGTTVEALASANGLRPTSVLHPGQVLQVPRRGEPPGAAARA